MRHEVHHWRVERAEGLAEDTLAAKEDAVELPVVEEVLGIAGLDAGARGEIGGLAVVESTVARGDSESGGIRRRHDIMSRIGLDKDRLEDPRPGDSQVEHRVRADRGSRLLPASEQIPLAGGGGELGVRAVLEEARARHAARACRSDGSRNLIGGQRELGHKVAVCGGIEGITGAGADKGAVLRPAHKLPGQQGGVRSGGDRDRSAREEGAAAADRAARGIGCGDAHRPVLQDGEAGLRGVHLRRCVRDAVVLIDIVLSVSGDADLIDPGRSRDHAGVAWKAAAGADASRCPQFVEQGGPGRCVDHAHTLLESGGGRQIARVCQIPGDRKLVRHRACDSEILHHQIWIWSKRHREGRRAGGGVVILQDDLVHLVREVCAGDQIVIPHRALGQRRSAGHGV